jgi:hypothetical protein
MDGMEEKVLPGEPGGLMLELVERAGLASRESPRRKRGNGRRRRREALSESASERREP